MDGEAMEAFLWGKVLKMVRTRLEKRWARGLLKEALPVLVGVRV